MGVEVGIPAQLNFHLTEDTLCGAAIGGAIGFGFLWGYRGVLMGSILSQLIIILGWKPYMLFTMGLKVSPQKYFIPVILRHVLLFVDIIILSLFFDRILPYAFSNYLEFFGYAIMVFIIVFALILGEFWLFSQGVRDFSKRMYSVIRGKYK